MSGIHVPLKPPHKDALRIYAESVGLDPRSLAAVIIIGKLQRHGLLPKPPRRARASDRIHFRPPTQMGEV